MHPENKQIWLSMIPLTMICALCILLLISTNHCTEDQIELNRQRLALRLINEVMPLEYNNDLFTDRIEIAEGNYFSNKVNAYRVRNDGKPVGIVFMPVVGRGYKGRIELVIGLSLDGTVTGVRVNKHQETEGQGDRIDQRKSDWILGFDGRSLANTSTGDWAVASDGGDFDQLSGATISPRGVINAVKKTLDYYSVNKDRLY